MFHRSIIPTRTTNVFTGSVTFPLPASLFVRVSPRYAAFRPPPAEPANPPPSPCGSSSRVSGRARRLGARATRERALHFFVTTSLEALFVRARARGVSEPLLGLLEARPASAPVARTSAAPPPKSPAARARLSAVSLRRRRRAPSPARSALRGASSAQKLDLMKPGARSRSQTSLEPRVATRSTRRRRSASCGERRTACRWRASRASSRENQRAAPRGLDSAASVEARSRARAKEDRDPWRRRGRTGATRRFARRRHRRAADVDVARRGLATSPRLQAADAAAAAAGRRGGLAPDAILERRSIVGSPHARRGDDAAAVDLRDEAEARVFGVAGARGARGVGAAQALTMRDCSGARMLLVVPSQVRAELARTRGAERADSKL